MLISPAGLVTVSFSVQLFSPWSLNTVILWAHLFTICICIIFSETTYQNVGAEADLCQNKSSNRLHITVHSPSQTQSTRGLLAGEQGLYANAVTSSHMHACVCVCDKVSSVLFCPLTVQMNTAAGSSGLLKDFLPIPSLLATKLSAF